MKSPFPFMRYGFFLVQDGRFLYSAAVMRDRPNRSKDIISLIRPGVRGLTAYHVDETPVRIKLDAMENPYPLPAQVRREIAKAAADTRINLYPDPTAKELKKMIGSYWNIRPDRMILGNGSDELIQTVILAFGGPVLVPMPTFAMYEITSRALAQKVVTVPLDKRFDLDAGQMISKAKATKAKILFLACPNNPTGNRFSDRAIRRILAETDAAVVIDEAYYSFSGKSYLPLLKQHPNLIILRTLSKIGLAGLRIGVLVASPEIVGELNKIRLPYNINSLSQTAAVSVLKHRGVLNSQISLLISERKKLYNAFSKMEGVTAYPSETNFIMVRTEADASGIHGKLKQAGILIKNLSKPGPLKNCLRITIGTPAENKELLTTFKAIINSV
jgi:histidinol-phosphate aminotransferase